MSTLGAWHRVKAHKTERFSWPMFINPSMDAHFCRLEEFKYNEQAFIEEEQNRRVNVEGTYEPGTQFGTGTYRDWHNEYVVNSDAHRRNRGHLYIWEIEDRAALERNEPPIDAKAVLESDQTDQQSQSRIKSKTRSKQPGRRPSLKFIPNLRVLY